MSHNITYNMPIVSGPYTIYSYAEDNPQHNLIWLDMMTEAWPEFMRHDWRGQTYLPELRAVSPETILFICLATTIIGAVRSVPIFWNGEPASLSDQGWDWALETGIESAKAGRSANTLCALEIAIAPPHRRKGLSRLAITLLRELALRLGYQSLIAPVRPSLKHLYPLIPIMEYIAWTQADGRLFDPWLRSHQQLGARIVKPAMNSMQIEGTIAEWQEWTGMTFPGSGQHIVPLALVPVIFDLYADRGTYIEPNVWMIHAINSVI